MSSRPGLIRPQVTPEQLLNTPREVLPVQESTSGTKVRRKFLEWVRETLGWFLERHSQIGFESKTLPLRLNKTQRHLPSS